jgi:hypothetical protein
MFFLSVGDQKTPLSLQINPDGGLVCSTIDLQELREEVGAALEESNVLCAPKVKGMAGVRARHLHAHHVLCCGEMSVWLAIVRHLPSSFAGVASRAVPDHEELGVSYSRLPHCAHVVAEQNEARDGDGDVAAARHILIFSGVCLAGRHHEGAEADGNEDDPEDLPGGHCDYIEGLEI